MTRFSLVIPVYKSEDNLPKLFESVNKLSILLERQLEVVFVVDGSPDNSLKILLGRIPQFAHPVQIIELSV